MLRDSILSFRRYFGPTAEYLVFTDRPSVLQAEISPIATVAAFESVSSGTFNCEGVTPWKKWAPTARWSPGKPEILIDSDVFCVGHPTELINFLEERGDSICTLQESHPSWKHYGVFRNQLAPALPLVNAGLVAQQSEANIHDRLKRLYSWWRSSTTEAERTWHDEQGAIAVIVGELEKCNRSVLLPLNRYLILSPRTNSDVRSLEGYAIIHTTHPDHPYYHRFRYLIASQLSDDEPRLDLSQEPPVAPQDSPLVSVIIPCYRQAHYLDEAIRSVLVQTYRHFEIIVVDDGSPDNTSEIAACYPGLRCIRQRHLGLPAARNAGLRASVGEIIVFLDADDRFLPDALETGMQSLQAAPDCAFVYGFCQFIDHQGAYIPTPPPVPIEENHYRALLEQNHIWQLGAVMFRRSILLLVTGFDQSLAAGCTDIDLYLRITKNWPIRCHGKVIFQYRKHRASMSMKKVKMLRASNDLFRKHQKEVKGDRELEEFCRNAILPWHRLVLHHPLVTRVLATARVRTRIRAIRSYFQDTRRPG